jgi:hypothetical protein
LLDAVIERLDQVGGRTSRRYPADMDLRLGREPADSGIVVPPCDQDRVMRAGSGQVFLPALFLIPPDQVTAVLDQAGKVRMTGSRPCDAVVDEAGRQAPATVSRSTAACKPGCRTR